jgi:hypothetical protein
VPVRWVSRLTLAAMSRSVTGQPFGTLLGYANRAQIAALSATYAPLSAVSKTALVVDGNLVREGTGGAVYRGTGYNATFVPNIYTSSQTLTGQAIDKYFASLRPNSLTRLRAYAPPSGSGISWATQLATLDAVVTSARKHGQRLIFCFTTWSSIDNAADAFGGKTATWFTSQTYKHSVSGATSYEDWVKGVVARYASDGTVCIYDLLNEPQDGGSNSASMASFVTYMSGVIKAIDPGALVYMGIDVVGSVGGASAYQTIMAGSDLCGMHKYTSQGSVDAIDLIVQKARALGKPLIIDEYGHWAKAFYGSIGDSDVDNYSMPAMSWEAQAQLTESLLRTAFSLPETMGALCYSFMDSDSGSWYTGTGRYEPINEARTRDVINTVPLHNEYKFSTDGVANINVWLDAVVALRAKPGTPIDGAASGNYEWWDRANLQGVTQSTTANAPTMQQGQAKTPSMFFNGSQYIDYNFLTVGAAASTFWLVLTPTARPAIGAFAHIVAPQSSGPTMGVRLDSRGRVQLTKYGAGTVIAQGATPLTMGVPNLVMVRWDSVGGTYEVQVNAVSDVSGSNAQSLSAAAGRLGAADTGTSGFVGHIHDFIYQNSLATVAEVSKVTAYLSRRHGIPADAKANAAPRSLDDVLRAGLGFQTWNYPPLFDVTANRTPISQTIYAVAVPYKAGQVVRNIVWNVSTAAAGTNVTGMYVGIADASGNLLAISANTNTAAAWPLGLPATALTAPYVIPADGIYYHLLLQNGTFGTTQPTFNSTSLISSTFGSAVIYGSAGTGQSSLGTPGSTQLTLVGTGTVWPLWTGSS